jgi:hypothetical protein
VEELRGQVDTLYCNIADLAQDNYRKMADKEEEWEEEKENLLIKVGDLVGSRQRSPTFSSLPAV